MTRSISALVAGIVLGAAFAGPGLTESIETVVADSILVWDQRIADHDDARLVPVEAEGDIQFTLDAAAFSHESGQTRTDFFLAVPHVPLAWVRTGQTYRSEVIVSGKVYALDGGTSRHFEVVRQLTTEDFESTLRKGERSLVSFDILTNFEPGFLEVRLEDVRSVKNTLIGRMRGDKRNGDAAGFVRLSRALDPERSRLSSLGFGSRMILPDDPAPLIPGETSYGDLRFIPNPTRYYGKRQAVFPVYYEEYGAADQSDSSSVRYRVRDVVGNTILSADVRYGPPGLRAGRVQRFDVSDFPTGTYEIVVELMTDDETVSSATTGMFHVFWSETMWEQTEQEVLDDARVLLSASAFEEFEDYSAGRRAAYISQLWSDLDTTPGSGNAARDRFEARVAHADTHYRERGGGKLSDRGRLYIRYGPPDGVERVRVPTESDEFLDVLTTEFEGKLGYIVDEDDPRYKHFLRRSFNRRFNQNVGFEIWTYNGSGDPILENLAGPPRGMAFIFVDENGVGQYELAYSSVLEIM